MLEYQNKKVFYLILFILFKKKRIKNINFNNKKIINKKNVYFLFVFFILICYKTILLFFFQIHSNVNILFYFIFV